MAGLLVKSCGSAHSSILKCFSKTWNLIILPLVKHKLVNCYGQLTAWDTNCKKLELWTCQVQQSLNYKLQSWSKGLGHCIFCQHIVSLSMSPLLTPTQSWCWFIQSRPTFFWGEGTRKLNYDSLLQNKFNVSPTGILSVL